jgi:hypothetical protein
MPRTRRTTAEPNQCRYRRPGFVCSGSWWRNEKGILIPWCYPHRTRLLRARCTFTSVFAGKRSTSWANFLQITLGLITIASAVLVYFRVTGDGERAASAAFEKLQDLHDIAMVEWLEGSSRSVIDMLDSDAPSNYLRNAIDDIERSRKYFSVVASSGAVRRAKQSNIILDAQIAIAAGNAAEAIRALTLSPPQMDNEESDTAMAARYYEVLGDAYFRMADNVAAVSSYLTWCHIQPTSGRAARKCVTAAATIEFEGVSAQDMSRLRGCLSDETQHATPDLNSALARLASAQLSEHQGNYLMACAGYKDAVDRAKELVYKHHHYDLRLWLIRILCEAGRLQAALGRDEAIGQYYVHALEECRRLSNHSAGRTWRWLFAYVVGCIALDQEARGEFPALLAEVDLQLQWLCEKRRDSDDQSMTDKERLALSVLYRIQAAAAYELGLSSSQGYLEHALDLIVPLSRGPLLAKAGTARREVRMALLREYATTLLCGARIGLNSACADAAPGALCEEIGAVLGKMAVLSEGTAVEYSSLAVFNASASYASDNKVWDEALRWSAWAIELGSDSRDQRSRIEVARAQTRSGALFWKGRKETSDAMPTADELRQLVSMLSRTIESLQGVAIPKGEHTAVAQILAQAYCHRANGQLVLQLMGNGPGFADVIASGERAFVLLSDLAAVDASREEERIRLLSTLAVAYLSAGEKESARRVVGEAWEMERNGIRLEGLQRTLLLAVDAELSR